RHGANLQTFAILESFLPGSLLVVRKRASRSPPRSTSHMKQAKPASVVGSHRSKWAVIAKSAAVPADAPKTMRACMAKKSKVPIYPGELGNRVASVAAARAKKAAKGLPG